jgi:hypothetical protein
MILERDGPRTNRSTQQPGAEVERKRELRSAATISVFHRGFRLLHVLREDEARAKGTFPRILY